AGCYLYFHAVQAELDNLGLRRQTSLRLELGSQSEVVSYVRQSRSSIGYGKNCAMRARSEWDNGMDFFGRLVVHLSIAAFSFRAIAKERGPKKRGAARILFTKRR